MLGSSNLAADGVALFAVLLLLYIAWFDFWNLRIRNVSVLVLLALYAVWSGLHGFQTLAGDLGTGVILFLIGLAMWSLRMMGGGDVKLYFALGLFLGFANAGLFAVALMVSTVLFLLTLTVAAKLSSGGRVLVRLQEVHSSGKAPYAVPLCLAAIPVILLRLVFGG